MYYASHHLISCLLRNQVARRRWHVESIFKFAVQGTGEPVIGKKALSVTGLWRQVPNTALWVRPLAVVVPMDISEGFPFTNRFADARLSCVNLRSNPMGKSLLEPYRHHSGNPNRVSRL